MTRGERTFKSNINTLYEELVSAVRWNRPSILIVVCNDYWVKVKAMKVLKKRLVADGKALVENLSFSNLSKDEFVSEMKSLHSGNVVYFAINLIQSGLAIDETFYYRAINMQREMFVDANIRIIFWLNTKEAALLPVHAPDFWAFRHRVIEFFDSRTIQNMSLAAHMFMWHDDEVVTNYEQLKIEVDNALESLRNLPVADKGQEKIKLFSDLTRLFWRLGDRYQSHSYLEKGLELIKAKPSSYEHINLWIGKAVHLFYEGKITDSEILLNELLRQYSDNPALLLNLSILLIFTSRKKRGIALAIDTARKFNNNPQIFGLTGYILYMSGYMDEAIKWFEFAIKSSIVGACKYQTGLLICQHRTGELVNSKSNYLVEKNDFINGACKALLEGRNTEALVILTKGIAQRKISKETILDDLNLWAASHPSDLGKLVRDLSE